MKRVRTALFAPAGRQRVIAAGFERLVPLAAALALAACAQLQTQPPREAPPPAKPRPPVNLSGYSPAFKAGFTDGCETARGNARRDDERFAAESQYARGWEDGKAICGKR